mgnify:CR=1 FL=1
MSGEYKTVDTVEELKERAGTYDRYEWEEFKFEQPEGSGHTAEYFVLYKGEHVETFSLDVMTVSKIEETLREIRRVDPDSMSDWLNR